MLARLKHDIQDCVDCDQVYSPDADAKRLLIGKAAMARLVFTTMCFERYKLMHERASGFHAVHVNVVLNYHPCWSCMSLAFVYCYSFTAEIFKESWDVC